MAEKAIKILSPNRLSILLILLAVIYLPSLQNGYVGWDDALVGNNKNIRSLSPGNLVHIFVPRPFDSSYQPMRTLAHALVYAVNGTRPFGYLVFNILLYLVNVFLFYKVVKLLLELHGNDSPSISADTVSLASAVVFGLLPVHVEVISWLQGGKQTLMAAFFLGSFYCYLCFRKEGRENFYWAGVFLFVLSLASQPGALAMPLVILAYETFIYGCGGRSVLRRTLEICWRTMPFVLPAVILGFQLLFVSTVGKSLSARPPLLSSIFTAPILWGKYLIKLFLPVNLTCRYPLAAPEIPLLIQGITMAVLIIFIGLTAYRAAGRNKAGLFGVLWFALTLLPTSGLAATSTLMADRYLYLPSMGFALIAGLIYGRLESARDSSLAGTAGWQRIFFRVLILGVVTSWTLISIRRQLDWRDAVTLWSRVIEVYPRHDLANFNLAEAYGKKGMTREAAGYYKRAIQSNPYYGDAYVNLGVCLRNLGEDREAIDVLELGRTLRPDRAEVWINLGISYARTGQDSAALASFEKGINLGGRSAWIGYYNRAKLLAARGLADQEAVDFRKAVEYSPEWVTTEAWLDLGRSLESLGNTVMAVKLMSLGKNEPAFDKSCWRMLGNLQLLAGSPGEALESLNTALDKGAQDYQTYVLLGIACQQAGKSQKAVEAYRRALEIGGPDRAGLLNNLALAFRESGDLDQSEKYFLEALKEKGDYIEVWVSLGGLYRQKGNLLEARLCLKKALELCATKPSLNDKAREIRRLLDELK